jgi:hypothetical protein
VVLELGAHVHAPLARRTPAPLEIEVKAELDIHNQAPLEIEVKAELGIHIHAPLEIEVKAELGIHIHRTRGARGCQNDGASSDWGFAAEAGKHSETALVE